MLPLDFFWELCRRAADSSVHSMGTTYLALIGASIYPLTDVWIEFKDNGWHGVKQHWGRRFKYGFFIACGWWILLFCFHLVYKVPYEIRLEAKTTLAPVLMEVLNPPRVAYLHTPSPVRVRREPPIERTAKFAVMIPFDTAPNSLPIPMDDNPDDPLFNTYTEFRSLAMNGTTPEAIREAEGRGQISFQSRPISMEEAPAFLGKLLQYYIFQAVDNLQRNSMTVYVGYPTETSAGIEPPDAEVYSYKKLSSELAGNVFFRPFLNRPSGDDMMWKMKPGKFPRAMEIKFITQKPDKYLVRFERPSYFRADFIVQQFLGTAVGQVPKHFASKSASTIMQWSFIVTMRYGIERPDDDGFNPGSYAQWLDALYDGLHKKMEIDQSEKRSR